MRKQFLVQGAVCAGTMSVNKVEGGLPADESDITFDDPHNLHPDKPGSEPSGTDTQDQITASLDDGFPDGVERVIDDFDLMNAAANTLALGDGRTLAFDYLVLAQPQNKTTSVYSQLFAARTDHQRWSFVLADALRSHTQPAGISSGARVQLRLRGSR